MLAMGCLRELYGARLEETDAQAGMCILSEAGGASFGSKEAKEKDGVPTSKIMGQCPASWSCSN